MKTIDSYHPIKLSLSSSFLSSSPSSPFSLSSPNPLSNKSAKTGLKLLYSSVDSSSISWCILLSFQANSRSRASGVADSTSALYVLISSLARAQPTNTWRPETDRGKALSMFYRHLPHKFKVCHNNVKWWTLYSKLYLSIDL